MDAEFSCFIAEEDQVAMINSSSEDCILVKIKDSILTKKDMETLTRDYDYDPFDKCLDAKIVDTRIHDMREKISYDERRCGTVYLENTKMAAAFQFTQRGESSMCAQETALMRSIALKYVKHHMIFLPMRVQHHWFLSVIHPRLRRIKVLSSYKPLDAALMPAVRNMVQGLECYFDHIDADDNKEYSWWYDFKLSTWDIDMLDELPQQEDRTSSGLYMLKYMEHWNGRRLEKGFTQNLIDEFRKKLAAILVNSLHNEEKAITGSPEI